MVAGMEVYYFFFLFELSNHCLFTWLIHPFSLVWPIHDDLCICWKHTLMAFFIILMWMQQAQGKQYNLLLRFICWFHCWMLLLEGCALFDVIFHNVLAFPPLHSRTKHFFSLTLQSVFWRLEISVQLCCKSAFNYSYNCSTLHPQEHRTEVITFEITNMMVERGFIFPLHQFLME